ncbi:HK97 gp10 family phage protein [Paracidovorax cattleyae]|uniref:HK97 gp10 family phage protein n=1 Tax=Paracidovorax cattleyae TaxID=80868 RepID=UPI0018B00F6E|nr:HK97 gp10 family phage protein [Paracidovorax cattleyae]MBF9263933.1 HK97 gp10 family phage protein [Paracidovorax cattleyae]
MTFTVSVDTAGLESYLDELGEEAEAAARPAAQAGAQVLYERVQLNVAGLGRRTGKLAGSIYQAYSASNSGEGRATYDVSWNARKAPHGHLVEYGYLQRYVYRPDGMGPVVRPGMDGKPRPGRRATREQKDAYYVTLPAPRVVPGKAFVRGAAAAMEEAYKAAEAELLNRLAKKGTA